MATDATAPLALQAFRQMGGVCVWDAGRVSLILDHAAPAPNERVSNLHMLMRQFAREQGRHFYDVGEGICHQLMVERGHVKPGDLFLGADSHTPTYGALNAFGAGVGSTDLAGVLLTGKTWLKAGWLSLGAKQKCACAVLRAGDSVGFVWRICGHRQLAAGAETSGRTAALHKCICVVQRPAHPGGHHHHRAFRCGHRRVGAGEVAVVGRRCCPDVCCGGTSTACVLLGNVGEVMLSIGVVSTLIAMNTFVTRAAQTPALSTFVSARTK